MGYKDSYDTDVEYLGIVKDGAGVGRINVYPAKSSLLGTMATIIPNNNVDTKWLQYAISNLNLGESVDKATIPHIHIFLGLTKLLAVITQLKCRYPVRKQQSVIPWIHTETKLPDPYLLPGVIIIGILFVAFFHIKRQVRKKAV